MRISLDHAQERLLTVVNGYDFDYTFKVEILDGKSASNGFSFLLLFSDKYDRSFEVAFFVKNKAIEIAVDYNCYRELTEGSFWNKMYIELTKII